MAVFNVNTGNLLSARGYSTGVYQNYKTRLLHIGDLVYIEDKFVKYILNFKIIFDYKVKNKRSFGACKIVGNYLLKMLNFIIL